MPLLLCLETSTPRASVALLRGDAVLFEASFTSDRSHNSGLFAPLQEALAAIPAGEAIHAVIAGTGPGSYSGTRVGIAAAQGVALIHGCPAVGLSSLAAVDGPRPALAVGDGRRGSAWSALVQEGQPVPEPQLGPISAFQESLADHLGRSLPAFSLEPLDKTGLPPALLDAVPILVPDAVLLGRAWLALSVEAREALAALPPQPVYLRPPHITEAKAGHPLLAARQGDAGTAE